MSLIGSYCVLISPRPHYAFLTCSKFVHILQDHEEHTTSWSVSTTFLRLYTSSYSVLTAFSLRPPRFFRTWLDVVRRWPSVKGVVFFISPICALNNTYLNKILYRNKQGLIDYLLFYGQLKHFSLLWRRHHCRWRTAKYRPMLSAQGLFCALSCHTCCDSGPQFFRSHPKDRPMQSPNTIHKEVWRIYFKIESFTNPTRVHCMYFAIFWNNGVRNRGTSVITSSN
jgi:hypothetical protein